MIEDTPSIGYAAAQRAINNGAALIELGESFCTFGGTAYTHLLQTRRKTYRVSRSIAAALHVPKRNALQCAARGCDGCTVCKP